MSEDFSLYEFSRSLSIVGWIVVIAVLIAAVYLIAKGTELLVTQRCPFCDKRIPKRATQCDFCKKGVG
jgi:hypothetical protein